jgi:hypothetical protein
MIPERMFLVVRPFRLERSVPDGVVDDMSD